MWQPCYQLRGVWGHRNTRNQQLSLSAEVTLSSALGEEGCQAGLRGHGPWSGWKQGGLGACVPALSFFPQVPLHPLPTMSLESQRSAKEGPQKDVHLRLMLAPTRKHSISL